MRRDICLAASLLLAVGLQAQELPNEDGKKLEKEKMETRDYRPEIHGTLRGKFEYQPEMKAGRFQVRNARFSLTGNVHPSVAYKAEIDLSDEGRIKMLDAYTKWFPWRGLSATIGQMRVPFTIDAHRSPHLRFFANRSFIAKQVGNVRDVGLTLGYDFAEQIPFILEAGIYNGDGINEQKQWQTNFNYTAKAQWFPIEGYNLTLSMQTIQPQDVRIFMYDVGTFYERAGWHFEAEYLYKHYEDHAFQNVHAANAIVFYALPLRKVFSHVTFLGRYDMMTNHSDGLADESTGKLVVDDWKRHRATGGITLGIAKKRFVADLRLNYEKYFYPEGSVALESEQDKLVIEFMTRF